MTNSDGVQRKLIWIINVLTIIYDHKIRLSKHWKQNQQQTIPKHEIWNIMQILISISDFGQYKWINVLIKIVNLNINHK